MISRNAGRLLIAAAVLAACDLDTVNTNDPDEERALATPGDVEALIGSSWLNWFDDIGNGDDFEPSFAMSTAADEGTSSWGNFGMQQISSEPRAAFPNSTAFTYIDVVDTPWFGMYSAISSVNDGLKAIAEGMEFGDDGEDTRRAETFAKFVQGLAHGWLALQFDRAFIFTEDLDGATAEFELQDYNAVMAAAIQMLDQAAALAESNSFTLPDNWINGNELSSDELARVARSYSARYLSTLPRTPEERAAVDWQEVLDRANAGITSDFGPTADNTNLLDRYKDYLSRYDWVRADYRTVGPADISGAYQAWLATPVADRTEFDIVTPDRRIMGEEVGTDGTDFYYLSPQNHRADRGTYHFSRYGHKRYLYIRETQIGFAPILTVAEMDLLKAEAYIRLGQPEQAAALINKTRTTRGQLPPVTADGVTESTDCVPRTPTGACGSLMDALIYEKRIETFGVASGLAFFDARGWGYLVEGTPLQFPIPAQELETLRMPAYTFGGIGGASAAP